MYKLFTCIFIFIFVSNVYANKEDFIIPAYKQIHIVGDNVKNGFFDPSIEYDSNGVGWMSYSRVEIPQYVETHMAKTMDNGKNWKYMGAVNKSRPETFTARGKGYNGVWRYETSALAYDPLDTPNKRWKVFSHKYYTKPPFKPKDRFFDYGGIAYQYAPSPMGPWSEGKCLLGNKKSKCKVDFSALHSDLKDMVFWSEVGVILDEGVIYLSVDVSNSITGLGKWKKRKIVLISSADHGKTWKYLGTLLDFKDSSDFGYLTFTGTSLVREDGRLFLLATPSGKKGLFVKNRAHDGIYVMELEDISKAKLKRDKDGKIIVLKDLKVHLHSGGIGDYDEKNTKGGVIFSQINIDAMPKIFEIYSTGQRVAP